MSWSLHRWVWQLESPLFIGMPPAGILARCRLYIPARNMWAALTERLAPERAGGASFPKYGETGDWIKENARFTYLFPAKRSGDSWSIWLPSLGTKCGLGWERKDWERIDKDPSELLPEREFRARLLSALATTSIDGDSRAAAENTLHETECVGPHWRDANEVVPAAVAMAGYVFIRKCDEGAKLKRSLLQLAELNLGGDTRYGFGRIRRVEPDNANEWPEAGKVFDAAFETRAEPPDALVVRSKRLLSHALVTVGENRCEKIKIRGARELLVRWEQTQQGEKTLSAVGGSYQPLWVPGSRVYSDSDTPSWLITKDGFWKLETS